MPTYAEFGGWVISTFAGWFVVTADTRVVQLAAQGMGVRAIGGRVGMHYNQVAKWRRRYLRGGIGALQDEPRSGRKGNISTEVLRQIVDKATRPPQGRVRLSPRRPCSESGVKTKLSHT